MTYSCPQCSAETTQSLDLVHESGIAHTATHTSGSAIGIGVGAAGVGLYSGNTSGVTQNALSRRLGPPEKESYVRVIIIYFFLVPFFIAGVGGGLLSKYWISNVFGICFFLSPFYAIYVLYKTFRFNRREWVIRYQRWQNSYLCLRCNTIFDARER